MMRHGKQLTPKPADHPMRLSNLKSAWKMAGPEVRAEFLRLMGLTEEDSDHE